MSDRISRVFTCLFLLPPLVFAQESSYRFGVRPGPLAEAIRAFEATTALRVDIRDGLDLQNFTSPGLTGVLDPRAALEALVAGTGLSVERTAGGFVLRIAAAPVRVDVVGEAESYRVHDASTAMKTLTPLRDIPQTVNVVPAVLLRDQAAQSVADAMRNVPGVTVAQGEGNRDQLVMRGTSTSSDFFVNGIRDDQERFRDLYNVDAIEVVQGPAAVLFGRGGAGGIVNLITSRPVRGARPEAGVELGTDAHKRATLQLGMPVGAAGAFRVAMMGQDSGGFRDGFFLHRYGVSPTLGLPLGPRTSLTLGGEYLADSRLADRGIPSSGGAPADVPASQLFGSRTQNRAQSGVASARATLEHRVSSTVLVRNSFLAGRYDKSYTNVYPGTAVSASGTLSLSAYDHQVDRINVFNQTEVVYDVSLFGLGHTILAGIEAGRQSQDELRHTAAAVPGVTLASSERDADLAGAPLTVDRDAFASVLGGYAQDQIVLTRHVKAVAGARVDRFLVRVGDHLTGAPSLARTDVAISPRAGVILQPSHAVSLYGSYSYSFLPSGQTLGLARNTAQLGPENAKNYEAGAKLDLLGGRFGAAAAVFRLDRNNVKSTDPLDPSRLVLTGQQRTAGIQVSLSGSLTDRWKLTGGYANLRARITRDTASAPAGRLVGLVPRHQGTLWTTYDFTDRFGAGAGLVRQSRAFTSSTNQVALPGYTRADALAYYRLGRHRVALNIENLFDARYYPTANGDNNISPGRPRAMQVSFRTSF